MAAIRIHAHVERAVELHGEAASRIINLHGGHAEVCENDVRAGEFCLSENLRQSGEVAAMRGENSFTKTSRAKSRFGLWQLDGIGVKAEQSAAGREAFQNLLRVSAVTERAIHGHESGLRIKCFEDFRHHDGAMRPCWSFA